MITFPNAKINIGLNITEKRKDGFHNIETVFFPIKLADILEIQMNKKKDVTHLTTSGLEVDSSKENNLCFKAYRKIKEHYALPDINMHLHKIIPFGSGLGGGSSDAAFTLHMLHKKFNLDIPDFRLHQFAEELGSDCPFFLYNKPSYAFEKGTKIQPLALNLHGLYLMLVVPDIRINTQFAYKEIQPYKRKHSLKEDIINTNPGEWKKVIKNDFETTIFQHYPRLEKIKATMYKHNALYASLSGSGSAIYGLFDKPPSIDMQFPDAFTWKEKLD